MISPTYKDLLLQLREQRPNWGSTGYRYAEQVDDLIVVTEEFMDEPVATLLDFGAGTQSLGDCIPEDIGYVPYDPCIPGIDVLPNAMFDVIACIDVMEHVEYEYVPEVIKWIYDHCVGGVYFMISTIPAKQRLPNGANAHITVMDWTEWVPLLTAHPWTMYDIELYDDHIEFYGFRCNVPPGE